MGIYFIFDARSPGHFASLYLNFCKKYLDTLAPPSLSWLEVGVKDYLREDVLIFPDKNHVSVYISSEADVESASNKAASVLKRTLKPYPTIIVVYGAEDQATHQIANHLAGITGAKLYVYPLDQKSLKKNLNAKFTVLTLEEQSKRQAEKLGLSAKAIGGFFPLLPPTQAPLPPCPPATIGAFVDDERSFESFKNLLKATARIENARLFLFAGADYAQRACDYADLINCASTLEVIEKPNLETLFLGLSRSNFVVSLASSMLPLDAVFSVCSLRPLLSPEESSAAFVALKTQGLTIPVFAEEKIYETLVQFIERYDLLEFESLEQEAKELTSFVGFIEKLESLN
jgi:hypothetical protein